MPKTSKPGVLPLPPPSPSPLPPLPPPLLLPLIVLLLTDCSVGAPLLAAPPVAPELELMLAALAVARPPELMLSMPTAFVPPVPEPVDTLASPFAPLIDPVAPLALSWVAALFCAGALSDCSPQAESTESQQRPRRQHPLHDITSSIAFPEPQRQPAPCGLTKGASSSRLRVFARRH
jgi:hypothetical protein